MKTLGLRTNNEEKCIIQRLNQKNPLVVLLNSEINLSMKVSDSNHNPSEEVDMLLCGGLASPQ